ncbi:MAG TPA: hypothetical protein EYG03_16280 [Planctomycetes bacterium]|nr:hypothetical protein [Planctomycetota bacterium]
MATPVIEQRDSQSFYYNSQLATTTLSSPQRHPHDDAVHVAVGAPGNRRPYRDRFEFHMSFKQRDGKWVFETFENDFTATTEEWRSYNDHDIYAK